MALYEIQHLNFTYPNHNAPTLKDVNFSINHGDFVLLFGPSGSGKSTLLRHLKQEVKPVGTEEGHILFEGHPLSSLSPHDAASRIGMVFQNPDQQIVLSSVYEELAFGMENLGLSPSEMQRRIGEISTFLGINHWLYKNTHELSGGQKQLLNLASIMTLYPDVLLLDEPTSQLDPITTQNFLHILKRLNEEFSITIIMTEHHLEDVFPLVNKVFLLKQGTITYTGTPKASLMRLYEEKSPELLEYIPAISKLYLDLVQDPLETSIPLTPKDARAWFNHFDYLIMPPSLQSNGVHYKEYPSSQEVILSCKDLYFQYTKTSPLVLERIDLAVPRGCFLALLGGNGSGKSTFLKVLAGIYKPLKGKIKTSARIGYLPQNPMTLFHEPTVKQQLLSTLQSSSSKEEEAKLDNLIHFLQLETLLEHHPYDLSGGQMQKLALATVLLTKPNLLLLDEPTKGLDPATKAQFAQLLQTLLAQNTTLIMVSHDLEFVAKYATLTTLMFSGHLLSLTTTHDFFTDNVFYTTAIHRSVKGRLPDAITLEEVQTLVHS
ncbi:ATP-binding cassette domain-containing protein [Niameybacter massiliensis]|uniref:ATP-binding cassette domain-containing protein n=1 Tax=Holtiella tumoricola TaxID=3018743 RepID=A0AA42J4F9_9FIRM|nr:ABC transporter ATP-binding protein [Holtiella tumoricola]MDA3734101.1 ATP-binding cassette domain-containing protein [Holtiella tumoricola]